MSNRGSYYGWVFPADVSRERASTEIHEALLGAGLSSADAENMDFVDKRGVARHFRFFKDLSHWNKVHVINGHSARIFFNPYKLWDNPECWEITQFEYDLIKRVFDLTSASEAFGFDATQDNAYFFRDSNLDFFFSKKGPQLVLRHLEERRMLFPGEQMDFCQYATEYSERISWDEELESEYFTRFAEEWRGQIIRAYSASNLLVRKAWKHYFRSI